MSTGTALSRWLRAEMPRRGYPIEGPRAGGISRLAQDAGISQANMSRLVNGAGEPNIDTLRKIGEVFKVPLGEMMVHAGLAERGEIEAPRRGSLDDFLPGLEAMIERLKDEPEPAEPPGGFRDDAERDIWGLWRIPWPKRYAAILAGRAVDDADRTIAELQWQLESPRDEDQHPNVG